jgi:hypothetical protein
MAIKTIKIEDEVLEKLERRDPKNPLGALTALVKRFIDVDPADRALFVPREIRQKLDQILGKPVEEGNLGQLVEAIRRAVDISLGESRVTPSEAQLKKIIYEANGRGMKPADLVKETLEAFLKSRFA